MAQDEDDIQFGDRGRHQTQREKFHIRFGTGEIPLSERVRREVRRSRPVQ